MHSLAGIATETKRKIMKYNHVNALFLMLVFCTSCNGQNKTNLPKENIKSETKDVIASLGSNEIKTEWYSETNSKGVIIQNSIPRGGPYKGSGGKNSNYSFLIFFTRVINKTATPLELKIIFPADSFATGEGGNMYMKVFLLPDSLALNKQILFNNGVTGLESFLDFNKPTMFQRTLNPKEECFVNIGTVFYQPRGTVWGDQSRGGNRAELVLKGQDLFYRMTPQIDSLPCGQIISIK